MPHRTVLQSPALGGAVIFLLFLPSLGCEESTSSGPEPDGDSVQVQAQAQTPEAPAQPQQPPPWATRTSPLGGFPCPVDEVLANSCRRCHFEPQENDAPFALVKFEDTRKERSGKPIFKLMEQMVAADLMPPLDEPVEPKVTPLTAEQKDTLLQWLRAGAPRNDEPCD